MTIPQNDGFTVVLNRNTGQATYSADADTFSSEIDVFSDQVNTQATEMNSTAVTVNADAATAQVAANAAESSADYNGLWLGKTTAGTVGQSYSHEDYIWRLNVALADLSTSEPTGANTDWSVSNGALRSDLVVQKPVGSNDISSSSMLSIDGTSGAILSHSGEVLGTYTDASFSVGGQTGLPSGIANDSSGNTWVSGIEVISLIPKIFKYDKDGVYTGINHDLSGEMTAPTGMTIDKLGNFWLADFTAKTIFKYDSAGTYTAISFSVAGEVAQPTGVDIDSFGQFWVVDFSLKKVFKYNSDMSYASFNFSVISELTAPRGIVVDLFDNKWIVGLDSDTVFKYDSVGVYTTVNFPVSGQLAEPTGMTIKSNGNFLIVGGSTDTAFEYTPSPRSIILDRFDDAETGVIHVDSETKQAAVAGTLIVQEPVNKNEAASKNTVDTGDAAVQANVDTINARELIDVSKYAKFSDQKTSGTSGGASIVGTQTRTLNTTEYNSISGASLDAGFLFFTLPAGTYYTNGSTVGASTNHQAWLYDITAAAVISTTLGNSASVNSAVSAMSSTIFKGRFVLGVESTIRLEQFTSTAGGGVLGTAITGPNNEVYSDVEIWKLD